MADIFLTDKDKNALEGKLGTKADKSEVAAKADKDALERLSAELATKANSADLLELAGKVAKKIVKLWENASPSSNFAAQTVTLSSDDWDFLLIVAKNGGVGIFADVSTSSATSGYLIDNSPLDSNGWRLSSLGVQILSATKNKVKFFSQKNILFLNTEENFDVAETPYCTPLRIYGVKL